LCRPKKEREKDQPNHILANKTTKCSEAQFNHQVHIEEVPEPELGLAETE